MPLYRYRCECGRVSDEYRRVNDRDRAPECHGLMQRVITPTMVSVFNSYLPVAAEKDGGEVRPIKNKKEHEAFLRRNGYEELGNDRPRILSREERAEKWNDHPDAPMVDVEKLQNEGFIQENLTV